MDLDCTDTSSIRRQRASSECPTVADCAEMLKIIQRYRITFLTKGKLEYVNLIRVSELILFLFWV